MCTVQHFDIFGARGTCVLIFSLSLVFDGSVQCPFSPPLRASIAHKLRETIGITRYIKTLLLYMIHVCVKYVSPKVTTPDL